MPIDPLPPPAELASALLADAPAALLHSGADGVLRCAHPAAQWVHAASRPLALQAVDAERAARAEVERVHSQWIVKPGRSGRAERVRGLLMNDCESCRLAEAAGELESRLALAVDLGDIAIWRQDFGSGRLRFNAQALRMLDLPALPDGYAVGDIKALVHPDDRERALASAREALAGDDPGRPGTALPPQ